MAMSGGKDDGAPMIEMNMTPLIDVLLVLLIMFIITIPVATHAVNIDLPQPNPNPPPEDQIDPIKNKIVLTQTDEILWNGDTLSEAEKFKAKWSNVEALVGSHERLQQVAADLVTHLEKRIEALDGKAMAVCMSRRICVALYNEIVALRPDWHSEDDEGGAAAPPAVAQRVGQGEGE